MAYNSSPLDTSPTSTQGPKTGGDLINANFTEIPNMLALKEDKVKRTITTTNPTVNDDSSQGYSVWSLWANTTTSEVYRCINVTVGAAVWEKTTLTIDELGGAALLDVGTTAGTVAAGNDSRLLTDAQKTDLTDNGESTLHYHASDRARANHTGTQPLSVSTYDNTTSGLGATTGQAAIDETIANMSLGVNDIINGQFKIAQTGTSFVSPISNTYDLDGWIRQGNGGAVTISRVAGSVAGSYARESNVTTAKITLAAGDFDAAETRLLGYDCVKYINQPFVVSLRVKSSLTGIHCVNLFNVTSSFVHEFNILAADTWQDVVIPVPMGVPALNSSTNAYGFSVRVTQATGTTFQTATTGAWVTGNFLGTPNQVNGLATVGNKLTIEDVRINLGTVPLPNVTPYDAELARCRRYVRTESLYFRATAQAAANYTYAVYQIGNEMNGNPVASVTWSSLINCGTPALQFADSFMVAYAIASSAAGEFRGYTSAGGLLLTARL